MYPPVLLLTIFHFWRGRLCRSPEDLGGHGRIAGTMLIGIGYRHLYYACFAISPGRRGGKLSQILQYIGGPILCLLREHACRLICSSLSPAGDNICHSSRN